MDVPLVPIAMGHYYVSRLPRGTWTSMRRGGYDVSLLSQVLKLPPSSFRTCARER
jgi:hypothetical protein